MAATQLEAVASPDAITRNHVIKHAKAFHIFTFHCEAAWYQTTNEIIL